VSSDGRYQIACGFRAPIYLSNDYGGSWYETAFVGNWTSISVYNDGQHIFAAHDATYIYYSSDYGQTFTPRTSSGQRAWISISTLPSPESVTALAANAGIFQSVDYGLTWTSNGAGSGWKEGHVINEGEMTTLAVTKTEPYAGLYVTDRILERSTAVPEGVQWNGIACAGGCNFAVAVASPGYMYGIDQWSAGPFCTTLTTVSRAWVSPALSSDQEHFIVGDSNNGYLYYSTDIFKENGLFNGVPEKPAQIPAYIIAVIVVASVLFVVAMCACVLYRQRICKGRCGVAQADSDLPVTSSMPTPSSDAPQPNTKAPTYPAAAAATPSLSADGGGAAYQSSTVRMVPLPRPTHSAYSDIGIAEGPSAPPPSHNGGYAPLPTAVPTAAAVYPYSYGTPQDVVVVVAEAYAV
jgi:hypothetical protein